MRETQSHLNARRDAAGALAPADHLAPFDGAAASNGHSLTTDPSLG
jgi:hypothetical protein